MDNIQTQKAERAEAQPTCCSTPLIERKRGTRCCGTDIEPRLPRDEAERLSADLQALAHPIRLQLLDLLARNQGQVCVCDLEAALPVKQPTISHHLKLLCDAGLVDFQRRGLWSYYFVRREALAALSRRIAERLSALS